MKWTTVESLSHNFIISISVFHQLADRTKSYSGNLNERTIREVHRWKGKWAVGRKRDTWGRLSKLVLVDMARQQFGSVEVFVIFLKWDMWSFLYCNSSGRRFVGFVSSSIYRKFWKHVQKHFKSGWVVYVLENHTW